MAWTYGKAMKRQLLSDAMRGRPVKNITSVVAIRHIPAVTLDSCWGWDLRENEEWPEGLHALVLLPMLRHGPFASCYHAR
jgi:hypothetical protein